MLEPIEAAHAVIGLERRRVATGISGHPTPISNCDAQFRHLLDIHRRLVRTSAGLEIGEPIPTSGLPL